MGMCNATNVKKAVYYLKRNGLKRTWSAVRERMEGAGTAAEYLFVPVSEAELERQRELTEAMTVTFSIVVPAYRTKEAYLRELLDGMKAQSYPRWELILADATPEDSVEKALAAWQKANPTEERIRYVKLAENAGISVNTNEALKYATGDYVGLLDHDDVLTADALFEMARSIEEGRKVGMELQMLYSDEDKCNGDGTEFYEPNIKEDFNFDLLLSNNYICHFLVMKRELIQELGFRKEFDGAQDYDLVLRAVEHILPERKNIRHISKVLYHWRCHEDSTAANPRSKQWAYEAGRRALQDFANRRGYRARAVHLEHLGFYALEYTYSVWDSRKDIGAIGGKLIQKGRIIGGRYAADGTLFYQGLRKGYSGNLHRAALTQDAEAVDVRCMALRPELHDLFWKETDIPFVTTDIVDAKGNTWKVFEPQILPATTDYRAFSMKAAKVIHDAGYRIQWNPDLMVKWKR